jgi:hypothetical protein
LEGRSFWLLAAASSLLLPAELAKKKQDTVKIPAQEAA